MKIVVIMLSTGVEVIGALHPPESKDPADLNWYVDYPQQVRWWRDTGGAQSYEFIPYLYAANVRTSVPISKSHVVTLFEANNDFITKYRALLNQISDHAEQMDLVRRASEGNPDDLLKIK